MKNKKILFLSYDGMTDALGKSQVLSYLSGLSQKGHSVSLISFEKPERSASKNEITELCKQSNINWYPLSYTKKPPVLSTVYDLYVLWKLASKIVKEKSIEIVHCRGYITALTGEKLSKKFGIKYIFDMRGWWADEKVEAGAWTSGVYKPVYNFFKKKEMDFFKGAHRVVSLTYAGEKEINRLRQSEKPAVGVVPTCVNFEYFPAYNDSVRARVRAELNIKPDDRIMVYSGALGGNYPVAMLYDIFEGVRKVIPDCKLLILSKDGATQLPDRYRNDVMLLSAEYNKVHRYLMAADFALIYYLKTFSAIGRSPTKLGEYWAVGLQVLAQSGIGDLNYLDEKYPGGLFLMDNTDAKNAAAMVEQLLKKHVKKEELRAFAVDYFSLEKGVDFYNSLYESC